MTITMEGTPEELNEILRPEGFESTEAKIAKLMQENAQLSLQAAFTESMSARKAAQGGGISNDKHTEAAG